MTDDPARVLRAAHIEFEIGVLWEIAVPTLRLAALEITLPLHCSMLHSECSLSWEGCLHRSSEELHRRSGPHVTPLRCEVQRLRVFQLPGRNGEA